MMPTIAELMSRLLLTKEEVAAVLGVPVGTVEYLARMKDLPGVMVGKHKMWKPQTVKAFVEGLEEDGR